MRSGEGPDPGLFEVPTRLAAVYRSNGQLYEAEKVYEWVLERHDSRFAKIGLAAVYEDNGKSLKALALYKEVLDQSPRNPYALRGIARTLSGLGRVEEAVEAYEKAADLGSTQKDTAAAVAGLENLRGTLQRKGEMDRAQWIDFVLKRLRAG